MFNSSESCKNIKYRSKKLIKIHVYGKYFFVKLHKMNEFIFTTDINKNQAKFNLKNISNPFKVKYTLSNN